MTERSSRVRLVQVRDEPLSVDEVLGAVLDPSAGGVGLFVGVVRRQDHGRSVTELDYTAHPSAQQLLQEAAESVADEQVTAVAAVHRTGRLTVGDLAVVVAVSAPHRGPALEACHRLIDTLKEQVPIWKEQHFVDGTAEWVGL